MPVHTTSYHCATSLSTDHSYFQLNALKPGINGFLGLRVYWHCRFSCATQKEAMTAMFNYMRYINIYSLLWSWSIGIAYWQQLCRICGRLCYYISRGVFECRLFSSCFIYRPNHSYWGRNECLTLEALNFIMKTLGDQRVFFQFETITNVLVSSFRFI